METKYHSMINWIALHSDQIFLMFFSHFRSLVSECKNPRRKLLVMSNLQAGVCKKNPMQNKAFFFLTQHTMGLCFSKFHFNVYFTLYFQILNVALVHLKLRNFLITFDPTVDLISKMQHRLFFLRSILQFFTQIYMICFVSS